MKKNLAAMILAVIILFASKPVSALPIALEPYTFLDISDGAASVSGEVGGGHDIFAFEALTGDLITLVIEAVR